MSAPFFIGGTTTSSVTEDSAGSYTLINTFTFGDASPTDFHGLNAIDTTGHPSFGAPRGFLAATILDDATGGADTGTIEWTYTLDNSLIQDLAAGETRVERFGIPVVDSLGNTTTIIIDVTVTGTNDGPIFSTASPVIGFTEDSGPTLADSGSLAFNDVDIIDTHTVSVSVAATGVTTGLGLDNDQLKALLTPTVDSTAALSGGSVNWSFSSPNANFDYLDEGQVVTLTYTLTLDDGHSGTATRTVTVNITGTNDVATITVADPSDTESDASAVINFNIADYVTISDPDAADAAAPQDYVANSGSFVAAPPTAPAITFDPATGAVSYDRGDFNYLDAGESVTYTFTFDAKSGDDTAQTKTLVLTINGENDVATITTAAQVGSENDTTDVVSFDIADHVTITDADTTDAASPVKYVANSGDFVATSGPTPPAGTLEDLVSFDDSTGTVEYDRADFNWLDSDETIVYTFTFDAQSGNDAPQTKTITLTISGANDAATITVTDPANVAEADAATPVTILIADHVAITDPDKQDQDNPQDYVTGSAVLEVAVGATPPAGFLSDLITIDAGTGSISYDRASFNYLAVGQSVSYTITFDAQSGDDGLVQQALTFVITGENDVPTVVPGGTTTGGVSEPISGDYDLATADISGSFSFTDVDTSDSLAVTVTSTSLVWSATGTTPSVGVLSALQQTAIMSAFSFAPSGTNPAAVNWTFDAASSSNVDLNFLAAGETLTATFNLQADDGNGGTVSQAVVITFTGTNDAPSTSGARTAAATEGSTATPITGETAGTRIDFTDPDLSDTGHTFSVTTAVLGASTGPTSLLTPAQLETFLTLTTINQSGAGAGGSVHWSFAAPNDTFDFLADGETLVVEYAVTANDGTLSGGGGTITVTITGTNDIPTISMASVAAVTADEAGGVANGTAGTPEVSGDASGGGANWIDLDFNEDPTLAITQGSFGGDPQGVLSFTGGTGDEAVISGDYGTLFLKADGSYRYVLDNNSDTTQALDDADAPTEVFNYTIQGSGAGTAISTITINISGSNDAPVLSAITPPADVTEAGDASSQDLLLTGSLSVTDVDASDTLTASTGAPTVMLNGVPTMLPIPAALLSGLTFASTPNSSSGAAQSINWTYDPAAANLDFLAFGDTLTISFPVTVSDGTTASNAQSIVITIVGTNDQPIVTVADLSGGVTEDASTPSLTDSGSITFTDSDHSDQLSVTAAIEGTPATTSSNPTIPPALLAALNTAFTISGDGVSSTAHAGTVNWTFTLANSLTQYLAAGEEVSVTYRITLDDNTGEPNSIRFEDVTITITGTNDAPVITSGGVDTGSVNEPVGTPGATPTAISGTFDFTDADATDAPGSGGLAILSSSLSVTPGTLTPEQIAAANLLSSAFTTSLSLGATNNGTIEWDFAPVAGALDFLRESQTATLVFTVEIADGHGGTDTRDVTITLTGTNDVITQGPASDDSTGSVTEPGDATLTVTTTGTVDFRDADLTGNPVIVTRSGTSTLPSTNMGTLTQALTAGPDASGLRTLTWSYENSHANLNFLGAGDSLTDVFNIRVLDQSSGGFLDFPVTITVHGTNDAPVISAVTPAAPVAVSELTNAAAQDLAAIAGTLTVTDVDTHTADLLTASVTGDAIVELNGNPFMLPGGAAALAHAANFTFGAAAAATGSAQDISWSYDPGAADLDFLAAGDELTLTFNVKVNDGTADSNTDQTITITITGTNDTPTLAAVAPINLSETAANDTIAAVGGALAGADLDLGHTLTYTIDGGGGIINAPGQVGFTTPFGTFVVDTPTGGYAFFPTSAAINAIPGGVTEVLTFTVRVTDEHGASATQTVTVNITGSNDTPVITAQTGTPALVDTGIDNAFADVTGTLTSTDRDTGALATYGLASGETGVGTYGTLTVNADGSYTYVPNSAVINALQSGSFTDVFDIQVDDGQLNGLAVSTLTFNITAGNDTPEITAVVATPTLVDTSIDNTFGNVTGTLTSSDRDTGATATYGLAAGEDGIGTYGTLTVDSSGNFTFVPNASAINALQSGAASDVFNVQVSDGQGGVSTTTVTINVTGANDTPEITAEVGTPVLADTAASDTFANIIGQLDATDRDTGAVLTYSLDTGETGAGTFGALTINANGTYTYVPNAAAINALSGGSHTDVFDVRVSDGQGGFATTTLTINVTGANDAPVAAVDAVTRAENASANVSVLVNDSDVDTGDSIALLSITPLVAANVTGLGTLSAGELAQLNSYFTANTLTGEVQFNPGAGLVGAPESIFDRLDAGQTATIVLTYTIQDLAGLTSSSTVTFTVNGAKEVIVGTAGDDIAVPIAGTAYGDDIDGLGGDDIINSGQGNDIIVGGAGADQINSGSENDIVTGGQGDDQIDGATGTDTAIYSGAWADYLISQSAPATFTIADQRPLQDGSDTVQNVENFTFSNGTFSASVIADDAPVAAGDGGFTVAEDGSITIAISALLANDTDADITAGLGDILSISAVGGATTGTVVIDGSNIVFTPGPNFHGTASFTYTARDVKGLTSVATVNVTVTSVNDAPTGAPTAVLANGSEDVAYTVSAANLLAGFSDVDGDTLSVVNLVSSSGSVTDNGNGTFTISAPANANGLVTLTYNVSDGNGGTVTGQTRTFTRTAVNDAPTGAPTAILANGSEDVAYTVSAADLLAGFSDVDGDTLSVASLVSSSGSVTDNGNGTFTISAPANANGLVTLTYDVTDGNGGSVTGQTRTFTRTAVNDAPTGAPVAVLTNGTEDVAYTVSAADLLAGFSDADGDTLSVVNLVSSSGSVTDNGNGTFTISAPANVNGLVTLTYEVTDGNGGTITGQTRSFTRTAVNDAPAGAPTAVLANGTEDVAYTVNASDLLAGFSDVEGDTLSVANLISSSGSVTDNGNGTFTISAPANVNGLVTLTYDVTDGNGGSVTGQTRTFTRTAVNDAPTGAPTAVLANGTEDVAYTVNASDLLAGFSDVDGDTLSVVNLISSSGSVTDNGNGTFTISAPANANGLVTLTYNVSDGNGGTVTGQTRTFTRTAVNDAPAGAPTAVLANGTEDVAYTVSAADLLAGFSDVDGDTLSVANLISSSGSVTNNGNGTFTISAPANANGAVTLTYDVTDGNGGTITGQTRSFTRTAVNDAPTGSVAILGAAVEDQILTVVNFLADADGLGTISYQWNRNGVPISGATNTTYALVDADVGATITVTASYTDGQGNSEAVTSSPTTAVVNVNDSPSSIALTGTTIDEFAANGTVVGTISATDVDGPGPITFSIASQTVDGAFEIQGNALRVADFSKLDFEQALFTTHEITLRVEDGAGGVRDQVFVITVNDISPEIIVGTNADDVFVGGSGSDSLNGLGGADRLIGGAGDDTYFVDSISDLVVESSAAGGHDRIVSVVTRTLGANVEDLVLSGSAAINGTGNALANTITGNAAANQLNGGGGDDTLIGGDGNDTYVVDSAADVVLETSATGGLDRVVSSVSRSLGVNFEQLILTGSGNVNATGNALGNYLVGNSGNNVITGNDGNDVISGGAGNDFITGGVGVDALTGGSGLDTFLFNTASPSFNRDIISDFSAADDTIRLENAVFTALGTGTGFLAAAAFTANATGVAGDADDRIVYNITTGALIYDVNGSAAGGAFQFATLSSKPTITNLDFLIV